MKKLLYIGLMAVLGLILVIVAWQALFAGSGGTASAPSSPESCSYETVFTSQDGSETVYVTSSGIDCQSLVASLSGDRNNWGSFQGTPSGQQECALTKDGASLNVYLSQTGQEVFGAQDTANGVCSGFEQQGYTP